MSKFTPEEVKNFLAYEKVRKSGRFNMFDPNARALTGLDKSEYVFVMKNYDVLKKHTEEL